MSFPVSPTNGQIATVNGITYIYNSTENSWTRLPAENVSIGNLTVSGISSNLTPTANVIYDLGTSTRRWKDLWLSGNTIFMGSESISVSPTGQWSFTSGGATVNLGSTAEFNPPTANIGGVLRASGNIVAVATTASTSTTTGALVVAGGAGIGGNAVVGGTIFANVSGNMRAAIGSITSPSYSFNISPNTGMYLSSSGDFLRFARQGVDAFIINTSGPFSLRPHQFADGTRQFPSVASGSWSATGIFFPAAGNVSVSSTADRLAAAFTAANTQVTSLLTVTNTTAATSSTTGALVVAGGAGIVGNVFTSGWIIPSSNVSQNLGTTTSWWNLIYGRSVQAQYADLAENYIADKDYAPGTVVVFGGNMEVTTTTVSHDTRVAGVVSTNPGYLMNAASEGIPVAFTGRVPCRVKGPVNKGTVLVTSNIAGVAEAINNSTFSPGCVLGKSLEQIADTDVKLIEVVVGRF